MSDSRDKSLIEKRVKDFYDDLTRSKTLKKPFIDASKEIDVSSLKRLNNLITGIAGAKHIPSSYALLTAKQLARSKTTTFGILSSGQWLLRLDNAHRGAEYSHININPKLTKVPDPHMAIPTGLTSLGSGATKVCDVVGKYALPVAVAVDVVRVGNAIREDIKKSDSTCHKTVKTVSSTVSSWAGGFGGAFVGNNIGSMVGGSIGAVFGGVGALPGAAIGALVGSLVGGVSGGIGAGIAAEATVNILSTVRGVLTITGGYIVMTSSFTPDTDDQKNKWLEIIQLVVHTALADRQMCVITHQPTEQIFDKECCDSLTPQDMPINNGLFMTKGEMTLPIVKKACDTIQFLSSFLAFVDCDFVLTELVKLNGCSAEEIPNITGELICMNSDGSTLYWINPENGAEEAVERLTEKQGEIVKVKICENKKSN